MGTEAFIVGITALFIIGMTWLRTRLQYARGRTGPLLLQPAGRIYFGCFIAALALGWLVAPPIGRALWPPGQTATLMRVVWFLSMYFLFIAVHGLLRTRGILLFRTHANADEPTG